MKILKLFISIFILSNLMLACNSANTNEAPAKSDTIDKEAEAKRLAEEKRQQTMTKLNKQLQGNWHFDTEKGSDKIYNFLENRQLEQLTILDEENSYTRKANWALGASDSLLSVKWEDLEEAQTIAIVLEDTSLTIIYNPGTKDQVIENCTRQ